MEHLEWEPIRAYRVIFFVYAGLGVVMICVVLSLSKACELEELLSIEDVNTLSTGGEKQKRSFILSKMPRFSRRSKLVVVKLCALFALESFGSNLTPL